MSPEWNAPIHIFFIYINVCTYGPCFGCYVMYINVYHRIVETSAICIQNSTYEYGSQYNNICNYSNITNYQRESDKGEVSVHFIYKEKN